MTLLDDVLRLAGLGQRYPDETVRRLPRIASVAPKEAWRHPRRKSRLAALSGADAAGFREAVATAAEPFVNGGRLRLVETSLFVTGRK